MYTLSWGRGFLTVCPIMLMTGPNDWNRFDHMPKPTHRRLLSPVWKQTWLLLSVLCLLPWSAMGQEQLPLLIQQRLEELNFGTEKKIASEPVYTSGLLLDLYRKNRFQPLWSDRGAISQLLSTVVAGAEEGLIPDDYHLQAITHYGKELEQESSLTRLVEYDLLLSDAMMLLAQHKRFGKVDPRQVEEKHNLEQAASRTSLNDACLAAIRDNTVRQTLDRFSPPHPAYVNLKQALGNYRKIAGEGGWRPVPAGPSLKPGMRDDRVQAMRKRLAVTGDLKKKSNDPTLYDDGLVAAVKAFQARHHLEPDGVVGKTSIQAMNAPVGDRINQIRVNLERTRWVIHDMPSSNIIIDIAGFKLYYYHNSELVWRTKVMVGQPYNQTPVFRSAITYMVLNPTWTLPPDIVKNETIPKILTERDHLGKQNIRVLTSEGVEVNPASVPWRQYLGKRLPYTLRQDSGVDNSLGLIKLIFPNPYHVYLHDTPSKSLFDRYQRAFSHGCIRVQNPLQLGKMLIANDPGNTTTEARFDQILSTGKTTTVFLKQPLPIFLMYLTANVQEGAVLFKPDLYNRDQSILDALNGRPAIIEEAVSIPEAKGAPPTTTAETAGKTS